MKEDLRRYNLWLAFTAGLRPMRHNELIEEYGSAYDVFLAAAKGDIPSKTAADGRMLALMKAKAEEGYIDRCLEYLHNQNISVVLFKDKNYPALLREIHSAPAALFVKGRLPDKIRLPIAVIGSRRCSDYGRKAAEMISGQLAECGACIVSGMAYGIDKVAAIAALERSKTEIPTIAVLGSGVDVVYPEENRKLYDEICDKGAGTAGHSAGFSIFLGNRIISGISRGVVVAEAAIKSGTRITADFALEQGRDVFAIPGRITDPFCQGTNQMIQQGAAKPVFCVDDILEEYGMRSDKAIRMTEIDESGLNFEQTLIVRLLKAGEKTIDELCEMTQFEPGKLNSALTEMEISGIIKQSPGRIYGI
ncbi:MAG: DNA-processing protein DprA [Christensenellales bacterium]